MTKKEIVEKYGIERYKEIVEYRKQYYKEHREELLEYQRKYFKENYQRIK